jgi:polyisoprenoid-binding protein YceI
MPRRTITILASIALALVLVAGAVAAYVLRPSAAPSGELTAIPVLPSPEIAQATAESDAPAGEAADLPAGALVFEIAQAESEARFIINEVLDGSPKTVVGVTAEVAGQILIDPADLSQVQVGVMRVNARTLTTDSGTRNNAIRNIILQTNQFEFVTFTPTQITGLPASAGVGDSVTFQMSGDLTVRDITQPVTFNVTVTVESADRIRGLATTTISRADFDLQIPSVPRVASVEETLQLELEFVALAQ